MFAHKLVFLPESRLVLCDLVPFLRQFIGYLLCSFFCFLCSFLCLVHSFQRTPLLKVPLL